MTEAIALNIPTMRVQALVLAACRPTCKIRVDSLNVGGDTSITVQSMITTKIHDIGATLQQIAELTAAGCDITRATYPIGKDAGALPIVVKQSCIPVIVNIHFNPKCVFAATGVGRDAVRVNPGNIHKLDDQVADTCKAAFDAGVSLRIGANVGSLNKHLLKKCGKATPETLVESITWGTGLFEENDFHDFKISAKHYDVVTMVQAYRLLLKVGQWPLHLGMTKTGPAFQGAIKSCTAFSTLPAKSVGDIVRVSLSAPSVEKVKAGTKLLKSVGLCKRQLETVSYPSCDRAQTDVWILAGEAEAGLRRVTIPLRAVVMDYVINDPGEAHEADLGRTSGNDRSQIFVRGQVVETVPEDQVVETLFKHAEAMAAEMTEELGEEVLAGINPMISVVG